jgi:hypothetical protein
MGARMSRDNELSISQAVVLIGGFITLLYTFYYTQQLSYSIGIYFGVSRAIVAYNITNKTAGNALLNAVSQSTTLALALHLTYALLPFTVIILAIGIVWLFSNSYSRLTASVLIISSIVYLILVAILEFDFSFSSALSTFPFAYLGGALALAGGSYSLWKMYNRSPLTKRAVHPLAINPDTPYSNMRLISNRIMRKLSGEIRILDMHFDTNSLDNLMYLMERHMQQYTQISVLTSKTRLGSQFEKSYGNFKNELANRNVAFELRVLEVEEAAKQHERVLMDNSTAYKIPPLNIINKKNEHIVGINQKEAYDRFNKLWSKATKYENLKS